jgi:hypothetical protein
MGIVRDTYYTQSFTVLILVRIKESFIMIFCFQNVARILAFQHYHPALMVEEARVPIENHRPSTPASSTTKTGHHDIAEILLRVALNIKNQSINQSFWEII